MISKLFSVTLLIALFSIVTLPVYAQAPDNEEVCFCHNINNNPITVCTSTEGLINGHMGHVENGSDTLGICAEDVPVVPEFGLITGIVALASSAGIFLKMKQVI